MKSWGYLRDCPALPLTRLREARRAERGRAARGRRGRVRAAAVEKRPWSRSREGGMQSASDTPSSHSSQGRVAPDRAPRAHVVAQRGPERGEPGPKQVVAKERVRPTAGAPGRIHERHATLRHPNRWTYERGLHWVMTRVITLFQPLENALNGKRPRRKRGLSRARSDWKILSSHQSCYYLSGASNPLNGTDETENMACPALSSQSNTSPPTTATNHDS